MKCPRCSRKVIKIEYFDAGSTKQTIFLHPNYIEKCELRDGIEMRLVDPVQQKRLKELIEEKKPFWDRWRKRQ